MTKSHPSYEEETKDVYKWIDILQHDPDNEEIKEQFVLHYESCTFIGKEIFL